VKGSARPSPLFVACTCIARATLALTGPLGAALGTPESPHGAEPKHGLASARLDSELGSSGPGRAPSSPGAQQHERPWHFVPHLQWCAADTELCAHEIDAAAAF
jgi:hypothetical protein